MSAAVKARFPMAGFHRAMLEGAAAQSREVAAACERTIRGETEGELNEACADPVALLAETAKHVGGIEMLLRLDDEARTP